MKIITDESCVGYSSRGHPERPARVARTLDLLRNQPALAIDWVLPAPAEDEPILRAHAPEVLGRLRIPQDFDADTPYYAGIENYARISVGAALETLRLARSGEVCFSLMRPPGHHATRTQSMGFCFLNNVAIAALHARASGLPRVAVFDFDVHHGNGTEDILLNQPGTAFFSVHQFPCYPGTGGNDVGDNCFNYTVPPNVNRADYRTRLAKALADLKSFAPELVAVSAGFDGYVRDPLAQGALEEEDFYWLGRELRSLGVPLCSLLEGGYSNDLPKLIFAYLKGIAGT